MGDGTKLWKIDDLREFLGYESNERAMAAVKTDRIPHVVLGGGTVADRGAARRIRFVPSQVHAWAVSAQVVVEKPAGDEPEPAVGAGQGRAGRTPASAPEWRGKKVGPRKR